LKSDPKKGRLFSLQFPVFFGAYEYSTPQIKEKQLMNNASGPKITDIKINPDNLYKEESFTDLTFATIRLLTPVNIDGSADESRETIFTGMTQLMSPNGPIPVQCLIEGAKNLGEAVAKLPEAIEKTVQAMIAEAKEMQRQESSKIIVPGQ
jgi:hypothetical protein